jgi:hypothetical protein
VQEVKIDAFNKNGLLQPNVTDVFAKRAFTLAQKSGGHHTQKKNAEFVIKPHSVQI